MRKYHTLVSYRDGSWAIEFGDYSRAVVKQEMDDTKERGVKYKIITTGDRQSDIVAGVAELNGRGDAQHDYHVRWYYTLWMNTVPSGQSLGS